MSDNPTRETSELQLMIRNMAVLLDAGRIEEAAQVGEAILEHCRANSGYERLFAPDVHYMMAIAARSTGQVDAAIDYYRKALTLKPEYPQAHASLANLYYERKNLDGAEQHYRRAVELAPGDVIAQFGLGQVYELKGDHRAAIEQFERVLALAPGSPRVQQALKSARLSAEMEAMQDSVLGSDSETARKMRDSLNQVRRQLWELGDRDHW
jgi:tetratricopeptide (TPR) repeat protein